ncbi:acetyltransferase [Candidatus Roizmanbacteria bacterium]|nr:acetyltransferase [Candidatus Roizmanbacteria bacterium]
MKKSSWTLFGAGYFIYDIIDAIESRRGIVTHIVLNIPIEKDILKYIPAHVKIVDLKSFKPLTTHFFYGFMDQNKQLLFTQLAKYKLRFDNVIHSFSHVAKGVKMGEGNFVGAGCVIAPQVTLGNTNIVNRMASIGHHTRVGHLNNISPGTVITGRCEIGNNNFFGSSATLLPQLRIKNNITVGAGAVVTKNLELSAIYIGIPARQSTANL